MFSVVPAHRDVRDPIHGFIRIEDRECEIVDVPVLQRLRRIRQLAMAYLIYPGAMHSRFEHTLGVLHVAGLLCRRLNIDAPHSRLIRLAALLHDIGHGPFSHVSEEVLADLASDEVKNQAGVIDKIHELITRNIIQTDASLRRLVSDRDAEDIIHLLDKGLDQPIYRDLVSGPLDADKQDYLLRDSYYCGVRYGLYDMDRLHSVLAREADVNGDVLVLEDDGIHTLEQFVLARYYLTTQVIRHKGRLISDAMLVRALTLGVKVDHIGFLQKRYAFDLSIEFVNEYITWNDERLMSRLLEAEFETTNAGTIMRRLFERRLYKRVFQRNVADVPPLALTAGGIAGTLSTLETEVADQMSSLGADRIDPNEVIIKLVKAPPARTSEGSVLLKRRGGALEPFESRSQIFKQIDQTLRDEYIECYAPITDPDEQKRHKLETTIDELIVNRIQELLASGSLEANVEGPEAGHAS